MRREEEEKEEEGRGTEQSKSNWQAQVFHDGTCEGPLYWTRSFAVRCRVKCQSLEVELRNRSKPVRYRESASES